MKQILLFAFLLLAFSSISAQEHIFPSHSEYLRKMNQEKLNLLKDTVFSQKILALTNGSNAKFLYESNKGKVYALPLDNMPWLLTSIHSNMPVYKNSSKSYIPNAIPGKEIIVTSQKK